MWLVMNKGEWTRSPKQIALTIVNLVILGIALAIVCLVYLSKAFSLANKISADWVCMCRASRSMRVRPLLAGPVRIMPRKLAKVMMGAVRPSLLDFCFI